MRIPTLHLNGSSPQVLKDGLCDAAGALRKALNVMSQTAYPHARDYYVQDEQAFGEACREHDDRCQRVRAVMAEYELILEGLQEQIDARDAQRTR